MKSQGLRPRTLTQIEQRNRGCGSSLSPRRFSGQSRGARLGTSAWPRVGQGWACSTGCSGLTAQRAPFLCGPRVWRLRPHGPPAPISAPAGVFEGCGADSGLVREA